METMRTFVAVELPENVRRDLEALQSELKKRGLGNLKWVSPEGIHLTLKFLGDVGRERLPDMAKVLDGLSCGFYPFEIGIKGLGAFPGMSRARVVWVGLTGELGRLQMLAEAVENGLSGLGFEKEKRPFSPHLTLARVRPETTSQEHKTLADVLGTYRFNLSSRIKVNGLSLMQSTLTPRGAIYNRLHRSRLLPGSG
jgi:2'-5' RNA ligase